MKYWFRNIMRRLEREPEAPVNVRLTWPNGQTVPIECVPDGVKDGRRVWHGVYPLAAPPVRHPLELASMRVDYDHMPDDAMLIIKATGTIEP